MKTLILSTPRTGSTYFTNILQNKSDDPVTLYEWFFKLNSNLYLYHDLNLNIVETVSFKENSYHLDVIGDDVVRKYESRKNTPEYDFLKWINFLKTTEKNVIIKDHVCFIPLHWVEQLIDTCDNIYYTTRNIKEQLASATIAKYTGVYLDDGKKYCLNKTEHFLDADKETFDKSIINSEFLKIFIERINYSNSVVSKFKKVKIVNYNDMPREKSKLIKKFSSSFNRLCEEDKKYIEKLCSSI